MGHIAKERLEIVIDDIFRLRERGVIAVGTLSSGELTVGQSVMVTRPDGSAMSTIVRSIELHVPIDQPDRRAFLLGRDLDDFLIVGAVVQG